MEPFTLEELKDLASPVIPKKKITFEDIAKEAVERVETGDLDSGFDAINFLYEQGVEIGGAIGTVVNAMEKNWHSDEGEKFLDAMTRKTPLHPATVKNHIIVKRFLESDVLPEHVKPAIEKADQKTLIRIAKTSEGYDLEEEDWEKIAEAAYTGEKSTSMVIRKITGEEPRSNWMLLTIDDRGVITAHTKEGSKEIGRLHINNKDEIVVKAIKRIVNNSGIQDKVEL